MKSLLFVLVVNSIFSGLSGLGSGDSPLLQSDSEEQVANFTQPQSDELKEDASDSNVNSHLLSDTNNQNHPHHSTADKHKRCPSYRVGSALKSRSGIVDADSPQSIQRRDLQTQFYEKMCLTCMSRHSCNPLGGDCPLCEKWCTKVNEEVPNDDTTKQENGPIVSPNMDDPIISMSSRTNYDEEDNRKNVYTIATLRTGSAKEVILKTLGVSDVEDVDTVVVWVTTSSNNPPYISNGIQGEQQVETSRGSPQILSSPNPSATEILPRYPIESNSDGFVMPQTMNPDIIEGPPSTAIMEEERERLAESDLLGSSIKEQAKLPTDGTAPDFLLREEPMRPVGASLSNQLNPGARMREFLENVKAKNNYLSRKNAAASDMGSSVMDQLEALTPNLQSRAREAMEKLKAMQLPRGFQKLGAQEVNNGLVEAPLGGEGSLQDLGTLGSQNIDVDLVENEETVNPRASLDPQELLTDPEGTPSEGNLQMANMAEHSLSRASENEDGVVLDEGKIEGSRFGPAGSGLDMNGVEMKTKLGARTNELLQRMKEKQDATKQSLLEAKQSLNAALEDAKTAVVNKFDESKTALGSAKENDNQESQMIVTKTNQERNSVPQTEILGSQPLENTFEKIQPFASRSSRPWQNVKPIVSSPKPTEEPHLGSPHQDSTSGNDENPSLGSRGQFEESPVSNALGAIMPSGKEMDISFQKPSDIYFIGNGIKLPLQMMKKPDGAVHFSVDMKKLCDCNNTSCAKNNTDIEKTVETILEKEAELKDIVGETQNQLTLGEQFEKMSPFKPMSQQGERHRNQRDTEHEFSETKNKSASTEPASDSAGISKTLKIHTITSTVKPMIEKETENVDVTHVKNTLKPVAKTIQSTTKHPTTSTTEPVTTTANYFEDFFSKKLDEIKSRMSEFEKKNEALAKDLLPQNVLMNFWNANKDGSTVAPPPSNLGSRIQEIFNRSVKKDLELYDNLASIQRPYQFKNLEKKMDKTIDNYTKEDDKLIGEESATLQSMNDDPVIKREVGIASNLLKFFKDLSADRK